jgi:cell division protein FtsB
MVIRSRLRAIVFPLALYAFSGGVTSYFVWHADNGGRGLKAKAAYKEKITALRAELADLRAQTAAIERKVSQFQSQSVDRDLLDEEARAVLGYADRNEVMVALPPKS